jgi:hypothetical protein|tara:strand:+ start:346 stop:501 length:156 start_codon:yes stop_codon:yes gene_type:complete
MGPLDRDLHILPTTAREEKAEMFDVRKLNLKTKKYTQMSIDLKTTSMLLEY